MDKSDSGSWIISIMSDQHNVSTSVQQQACDKESLETRRESNNDCQNDQQNIIDAESERLLRNTKKQVKQMMEEAVTKKFIHEESSSIISLCVAVDACLSHGLKRRALGLFKTSSSTALIQKVAKQSQPAQEVLELVCEEEKRMLIEQQEYMKKVAALKDLENSLSNSQTTTNGQNCKPKSPLIPSKFVASNFGVYKRILWIKLALIEKKLVDIVDHLSVESSRYYEPKALMSNYLCAQILSSLLVGPSALEFSRSKTNDYYQFDDPSADELLRRHNLANPIACLCNNSTGNNFHNQEANNFPTKCKQNSVKSNQFHSRSSISDNSTIPATGEMENCESNCTSAAAASEQPSQQQTEFAPQTQAKERRRKPLALKTSVKGGTLVTDCHHYDCQEISEHQQTRGYSFLCTHSNGLTTSPSSAASAGLNSPAAGQVNDRMKFGANFAHGSGIGSNSADCWTLWSPRMLHETLHQNSRSNLLYAKNNVLLETQPLEYMAGYLSLHQTQFDLILKWIPNQMINGGQRQQLADSSQQQTCCDQQQTADHQTDDTSTGSELNSDRDTMAVHGLNCGERSPTPVASVTTVESSYLDFVVSLPVSQIVLLHCQFESHLPRKPHSPEPETNNGQLLEGNQNEQQHRGDSNIKLGKFFNPNFNAEETLILVEADGVQKAPFKFPKGGLRLFLSCLETGLRPARYLEPAIKFDDNWPDPLMQFNLDSPIKTNNESNESSGSKLDVFLRRLPSMKRRSPNASEASSTSINRKDSYSVARAESPYENLNSDGELETKSNRSNCFPTNNYVYRIVSKQQPDWPLHTPPHSALSVGSPSSPSSNGASSVKQLSSSGQRFRWSLSRLARLSAKYANSGAGSTSSSANLPGTELSASDRNNSNSLDNSTLISSLQATQSQDDSGRSLKTSSLDLNSNNDNNNSANQNKLKDLVRIEAKLDDLKKSTSNELLALRTKSLQTLCDSMKKQILARAFYGWLAHCRKVKIIKTHLVKLIKTPPNYDKNYREPLNDEDDDDMDDEDYYRTGLTFEAWNRLIENKARLSEARLCMKVNHFVYLGGIENDELRKIVWPYLLNHYKFRDSKEMREAKDKSVRDHYESCARDWSKIERVVKQRDNEILAFNMAKARQRSKLNEQTTCESANKVKSTQADDYSSPPDQAQLIEANLDNDQPDSLVDSSLNEADEMIENEEISDEDNNYNNDNCDEGLDRKNCKNSSNNNKKRKPRQKPSKRRYRLESTGSVGSDASITDLFGNNIHRIDKDVQRCDRSFWYFKDVKNLDKLRNIMCSYVWTNLDVGYVQGMCDLAAPFLVIFDDELMAYTCFTQLMKRMVSNFPQGSSMDEHFESLKYLMQVLDGKLFEVLQNNGDYTHFYFCYRWLLLDFKRELVYQDVYKVWETIWSARHCVSDHFVVFMALAMVRYYRDIIIENNMDFTDTIKFFNEMAEKHDATKIVALARECVNELIELIEITKSGF